VPLPNYVLTRKMTSEALRKHQTGVVFHKEKFFSWKTPHLHKVLTNLSRVLVFEPFFSHMTPICTIIEIPLARWHFDSDTAPNTEANLRKALDRLPIWTKDFDWAYVEDESSENYLVAESTGLEVTVRCWGEAHLKFKVVATDWFGEKRDDSRLIPRKVEDLGKMLNDSFWTAKEEETGPVKFDQYMHRYQYYSSRAD